VSAPAGRRRVVDAVLRIVADPSPAAYYACAVCPYTASVKGRRATAEFVPSIRTTHRATCPGIHPERTAA
jgi:hypothetical protein